MTDTSYHLPVEDTLRTAWSKVHGSKATIWTGFIIMILISLGLGLLTAVISNASPVGGSIVNGIFNIIIYLLDAGLIYMGIKRAQDQPIAAGQIFRAFSGSMIIKLIILYILQVLILLIPFLLIFGGAMAYGTMGETLSAGIVAALLVTIGILSMIYLAVRLALSMGFVIDRETSPMDAIKLSFRGTRDNFWSLFWLILLQTIIIIVSAIPFFIGLIWTIPFALINYGVMYNRLSSNNL